MAKKATKDVQEVLLAPVERIFLDPENPRHNPCEHEPETIEALCRTENIYEMAKDIAELGELNPLENFAVAPLKKTNGKAATQLSYVVVEGNRRICALKLLHDPERAPADQRKAFAELSQRMQRKISKVPVKIFDDKMKSTWLPRIHGGTQGGRGRKPWNAEQQTRYFGNRNTLAQSVLDHAENYGFLKNTDRKNKLTTVQRYLGNPHMREALGIENDDPTNVRITRPENDFKILLKKFVDDLMGGKEVNSRKNSEDIKQYSRTLSATRGITSERTSPEPLSGQTASKRAKGRVKPKKLKKPQYISYEEDIAKALKAIPSYKLENLYSSLYNIQLEDHTPLLAVGAWSFFECLTKHAGSTTDFQSFLDNNRLVSMGFTDKDARKSIRMSLQHIADYGNTTKHHDKSAYFNSEQLANDMDVLKDVICKIAEEAAGKPKKKTP